MNLIFAMDKNGCIGKDGDLPWHIPTDLKFFKGKTEYGAIVMGAGTWDSFGGVVLPNRDSYVLSTRELDLPNNVSQLYALDEVFELSQNSEVPVFIIGGANLCNQLLTVCTNIYVTYVDFTVASGDTYIDMNKLNAAISDCEQISDEHCFDEASGLNIRFTHYRRIS